MSKKIKSVCVTSEHDEKLNAIRKANPRFNLSYMVERIIDRAHAKYVQPENKAVA